MKGNIILLGLVLSLGLDYDMEDDFTHQDKDFKGIVQNIFYIKYRIK